MLAHDLMRVRSLVLASAFAVSLLFARMLWTQTFLFAFLLWNLFLAWMPVLIAWPERREIATRDRLPRSFWVRAFAWLLFFPNAPYLVTDFAHLGSHRVPRQVDVAMLASFAWAGLLAGCLSLHWIHGRIRTHHGLWPGRLFVLAACGLAGFGIALGRQLRFNSWDIVTDPLPLLRAIAGLFLQPRLHFESWSVAVLFGALLWVVYLGVAQPKSLARSS